WDDSLRGGVETNSLLEMEYDSVRGSVKLSWDQALNNGLWIRGSKGEVRMDTLDIDRYQRREIGGTWKDCACKESWPANLEPSAKSRNTPHNYYDCGDLEWVNVVRSIMGLELPAV